MPHHAIRQYARSYGVLNEGHFNDVEPSAPLRRNLSHKNCGRYWTCGCGRRHRLPNVTRDGFACPNCSEVYRG